MSVGFLKNSALLSFMVSTAVLDIDRLDPSEFHAEGEAWMGDAKVTAISARWSRAGSPRR